ncbi:MAG TPA: DUF58 domain-containing protein [Syntrophales bacterium]|nr:DUF58 domain-containing protein [Syntrophales bacterium]
MLSEEMLAKIQKFHFRTRYLANDIFAGQYVGAFRGQGMEFAEVREYQHGDDIRSIDWNVSARHGRPFVKIFHEERELTLMLLIDLSGSHQFGTRGRFKRELLAEVAGMLAFLAIRTNDKVGAILFTSQVEKFLPPKKGVQNVWRLIKEIFTFEPESSKTNINAAFTYLNQVVKRHAIAFLLSDCMDEGFDKGFRLTAKKHDLTVLRIIDPAEAQLPYVGSMRMVDPETGENAIIDTSSKTLRHRFLGERARHDAYLKDLTSRAGVDLVQLRTDHDVMEPLSRLFLQRRKHINV